MSGALGAPRVVDSDFPMRSARVRRAIAAGVPRLRHAARASRDLGEIHFVHGRSDVEAYGGALLGDSARVALALEVGDSRLKLTRGADDRIDVTWTGTIHYPGDDVAFEAPMPLPWGPRVLRVSETVFCGMHADGAMNPYSQTYRWTIRADDPRLGPARDRSDRGFGERLAVAAVLFSSSVSAAVITSAAPMATERPHGRVRRLHRSRRYTPRTGRPSGRGFGTSGASSP